ncbi:uncharacterized protein LOC119709128 isoform X1 [Motacilla alba alba]|uniref:uncharacterized protein LOC119709128 isoform X1 n=1 Tax=Motacilla alba alba TaxID=1094192 RepID=UPI0018D4FC5D|nr:uncharacterized protein LOC119709128 isoform X1 [Motacilla alba alba]
MQLWAEGVEYQERQAWSTQPCPGSCCDTWQTPGILRACLRPLPRHATLCGWGEERREDEEDGERTGAALGVSTQRAGLGFQRSLRELRRQHRLHGKLCAPSETHREPSGSALPCAAPHGWWGWIRPARLAPGATNAGGWQLRTDGTARIPACREGALPARGGQAGFSLGGSGVSRECSPSPVRRGSCRQKGEARQEPLSCLAAGVRGQESGGPGVERVSRLLPPPLPSP